MMTAHLSGCESPSPPGSGKRSSTRFFLVSSLLWLLRSTGSAETIWKRIQWHEEAAWESHQKGIQAVVSEERARLIYLGTEEGRHNLLNAPLPRKEPLASDASPNWGGHRFWLGPQSRWNWPPPKDWEFSSAQNTEVIESKIVLHLSHRDPDYPEVEREYAWEGSRLRCTVRWRGGPRPFYAMQVVAIDLPAEMVVKLQPRDDIPQGLIRVVGDKPNHSPLPHGAVNVEKDHATIRSGVAVGKFGVAPQSLTVRRDNIDLILYPGPLHGTATDSPDLGYLTEIWVGDSSSKFCELEQISPYLLAADDGWCGSTVYLEARPDVSAAP